MAGVSAGLVRRQNSACFSCRALNLPFVVGASPFLRRHSGHVCDICRHHRFLPFLPGPVGRCVTASTQRDATWDFGPKCGPWVDVPAYLPITACRVPAALEPTLLTLRYVQERRCSSVLRRCWPHFHTERRVCCCCCCCRCCCCCYCPPPLLLLPLLLLPLLLQTHLVRNNVPSELA